MKKLISLFFVLFSLTAFSQNLTVNLLDLDFDNPGTNYAFTFDYPVTGEDSNSIKFDNSYPVDNTFYIKMGNDYYRQQNSIAYATFNPIITSGLDSLNISFDVRQTNTTNAVFLDFEFQISNDGLTWTTLRDFTPNGVALNNSWFLYDSTLNMSGNFFQCRFKTVKIAWNSSASGCFDNFKIVGIHNCDPVHDTIYVTDTLYLPADTVWITDTVWMDIKEAQPFDSNKQLIGVYNMAGQQVSEKTLNQVLIFLYSDGTRVKKIQLTR